MRIVLNVKLVYALIDLEVIKDVVNIVYPLFVYRRLVEAINVKCLEISPEYNKPAMSSIQYSSYDITAQEDIHERSTYIKPETKRFITIEAKQISIAFR